MNGKDQPDEQANFLLYTGEDGHVRVEVFLQDDTVWLTQKAIGELFGSERSVITKHLRNIFRDGELVEDSVCAIFAHTAADGKNYNTKYYNLDAIISVGYRVNSRQATQFRIWATRTLKEFSAPSFPSNTNHREILGISRGSRQLRSIRCQLSTVNYQLF